MKLLKKLFGWLEIGNVDYSQVQSPEPAKPESKKSKEPEFQKRTLKIDHEDVQVDVGQTTVKILFDDGTKAKMNMVGDVFQNVDKGQDEHLQRYSYSDREPYRNPMREPQVSDLTVYSSFKKAQDYLRHVNGVMVVTILDDSTNPAKAVTGRIKSATVDKTKKNMVTFRKAKLVPVLPPDIAVDEKMRPI